MMRIHHIFPMNFVINNSYLSKTVYDNLVPNDDFMRLLLELIDWREMVWDLCKLAKNDEGGRPRYNHVLMFKMLFLSFLFTTSDRDTEELCTNNIRCKYFLGLELQEGAPHFTTLCRFRNELLEQFGKEWLDDVFTQIVSECKRLGVKFGSVHALDATHSIARVDIASSGAPRSNEGIEQQGNNLSDPDARWGVKGTETKKDIYGNEVKLTKFFYGYKAHLLTETTSGLITALATTPGNAADIDAGEHLLLRALDAADRAKINLSTLTADAGYSDAVFIGILENDHGINTAIALQPSLLAGQYKQRWNDYKRKRKAILKNNRYVVEQVNGDLKNNHGFGHCRYLGLAKYHLQTVFTAMAHNLKIALTVVAGVRFRPT